MEQKAHGSTGRIPTTMGRSRRENIWYEQGLRFECTQCGQCCSGSSGLVEFTYEEAEGMAHALKISYEEFMTRYAVRKGDTWVLREIPAPDGESFDCVLLARDDETGLTRCTVHKQRPTQCRTWPFWPENLKSPRTWRRAARDCEGIENGPVVSYREICHSRDITPEPGATYFDPDDQS